MAERRMFQVRMLRSGSFMRLSWGAAYLYVQLCAEADDDGFTDNADQICRLCRCNRKHLQDVSLRILLTSDLNTKIEKIMIRDIVRLHVDDPQDMVAEIMIK